MPYYGDISGHFRGLLRDEFETCAVGVVGGPKTDCARCPKRAIRRVQDMNEAKWYDMKFKEKRRFFECFDEYTPPLSYGYAAFSKDDFTRLRNHYKLFEDVNFPLSGI